MPAMMERLARLFAYIGVLVLVSLIIMTCMSIVGRSINSLLHNNFFQSQMSELTNTLLASGIGAINGDFELVEAGIAFVIFAFLPICQLHAAHASVDVFVSYLPQRVNQIMAALIEIVFAAVLILIAVKLFDGMQSKRISGQVTFSLQFPIWWAYAFSLTGASVAALVSVYMSGIRLIEVAIGKCLLLSKSDINH